MRELTELEREQLRQHKLWVKTGGGSGIRLDWSGADLHDTCLNNTTLFKADLCGANLRGADLSRAYMSFACLNSADLRGVRANYTHLINADLSNSLLVDADLSYANLGFANLIGAVLWDADISCARIEDIDIHEAVGIISILPLGIDKDIVYAIMHADGWYVSVGEFDGTLTEMEEANKREHIDNEYKEERAAIIEALRALEPLYYKRIRGYREMDSKMFYPAGASKSVKANNGEEL